MPGLNTRKDPKIVFYRPNCPSDVDSYPPHSHSIAPCPPIDPLGPHIIRPVAKNTFSISLLKETEVQTSSSSYEH